MTNKLELEFGEGNYQGSKMFSSLAELMGLSVDLVRKSFDYDAEPSRDVFIGAHTHL